MNLKLSPTFTDSPDIIFRDGLLSELQHWKRMGVNTTNLQGANSSILKYVFQFVVSY